VRPLADPRRSLKAKFFLSHLLVALVAALTVLGATAVIAPILHGGLTHGKGGPTHLITLDEVTRIFGRTLLYSLIAAGGAAMLTAVGVSLWVSKRVSEPVRHMLTATRRIARGRYAERVPVRTSDELGALSESFNAMAASLEGVERRRTALIADVSHELRTPLATMQGYVEGLRDGMISASPETWEVLSTEANRMHRLVDDLQQLSRAETGQLSLNLAAVRPLHAIRLAAERMYPLFAEKGVRLELACSGTLPPALADCDRVVQVLTNLLANALRYTPPGGEVLIDAADCDESVILRVSDTGVGLAAEHLDHVFERFYRVEKSRSRASGGAGIGLAISRAVVEAMGGKIWAESAGPGRGTAFSFTLPVSSPRS